MPHGFGLGAIILWVRNGMNCSTGEAPDDTILWSKACASKSLSNAETHYCNIECEALGILHGLERLHYYCSAIEVNVITNHKTLVNTI